MNQNKQNAPAPTAEDISDLIAATFSEERPDPYTSTPEPKVILNAINDSPSLISTDIVVHLWTEVDGAPEWDPSFADKLEGYLYNKFEDEEENEEQDKDEGVIERRLEELRNGAPLTELEKEAYEEDYWGGFDVVFDTPVYYIHRLHAPPVKKNEVGDVEDSRCVYFVCEHDQTAQASDLGIAAGPFRSLEEVAEALTIDPRSCFTAKYSDRVEFDSGWDAEETAALHELFLKARERASSKEEAL